MDKGPDTRHPARFASIRAVATAAVASIAIGAALVVSVAAASETHSIYWHEANQCSQTGVLGAQERACEDASAPEFLHSHTVPSSSRFTQPLGAYCSYEALGDKGEALTPEETGSFSTPEPSSSYQMGDGQGNVCASWGSETEPVKWGLQLENDKPEGHLCENVAPKERCSIEHYIALNGVADRPWASYFQNPSLEIRGAGGPATLIAEPRWGFPVEGPEKVGEGWGWGYLCPVLQNVSSKAIIELCFEQWRGFDTGAEWEYQHVVECGESGGHPYDKVIAYSPKGLTPEFEVEEGPTGYSEPAESIPYGRVSAEVGSSELEAYVTLDDKPYLARASEPSEHGERAHEPELGYGCGRTTGSTPEDWALIGITDGIETWGARVVQYEEDEPTARTDFEAKPIGITPGTVVSGGAEQVTLENDITPYGFETEALIEYGRGHSPEATTPVWEAGHGLEPGSDEQTIKGLKPASTYYYRVKAYHKGPGGIETDVTYGPEGSFSTTPGECGGSNISGQGAPELAELQTVWDAGFDTSSRGCNGTRGTKGTPAVSYTASSSGTALESWESSGGKYGATNAFLGTAEPPSSAEIATIESRESTASPEPVETIPVAQMAVAILIHLPPNCKATSKSEEGRLAITPGALQRVFSGTLKDWSELTEAGDALSGSGCEAHSRIQPIVPSVSTGTSHVLKHYLAWSNAEHMGVEGGASKTWNELAERTLSTTWPTEASVSKAANEIAKVAETSGSLGFANLAEARQSGDFSGTGGGASMSRFWAVINSSKTAYKDPSTDGDSATVAEANCKKTEYEDIGGTYPPPSVYVGWNNVSANVTSSGYPICGLLYVLALHAYSPFTGTSILEPETVENYAQFVIQPKGGQPEIAAHDYYQAPSGLLSELERGIYEIKY